MVAIVTLQIPDRIYQRLLNTAHATKRPLEEVILHALTVGSPPEWDDVPEEFQASMLTLCLFRRFLFMQFLCLQLNGKIGFFNVDRKGEIGVNYFEKGI